MAIGYLVLGFLYQFGAGMSFLLGMNLLIWELLLMRRLSNRQVIARSRDRLVFAACFLLSAFVWELVMEGFLQFFDDLLWPLFGSLEVSLVVFEVFLLLVLLATLVVIFGQIKSLRQLGNSISRQVLKARQSRPPVKTAGKTSETIPKLSPPADYFDSKAILAAFDNLMAVVGDGPSTVYYRTNVETMTAYLPKVHTNLERLFQSGQVERFDGSLADLQTIVAGIRKVAEQLAANPDLDLISEVNDLRYQLQRLT